MAYAAPTGADGGTGRTTFRAVRLDRAVIVAAWRHPLPVLAALAMSTALVVAEARLLRWPVMLGVVRRGPGVPELSSSEATREIHRLTPSEWHGRAFALEVYRVARPWETYTICRTRESERGSSAGEPCIMVREVARGWPFAVIAGRTVITGKVGGPAALRGTGWSMHLPGAAGLLLTGFAVFLPIAGVSRWLRLTQRARRGRCPICAFDLRATIGPGCSECGWRRGDTGR